MRTDGQAATKSAVTSFDQPFPIDALTPDSFERFCLYFLKRHYPGAKVHRLGGPGHAQDGLDIEVVFCNGFRYGFQCKRVEEVRSSESPRCCRETYRQGAKELLVADAGC
jgi:hypothetical protein